MRSRAAASGSCCENTCVPLSSPGFISVKQDLYYEGLVLLRSKHDVMAAPDPVQASHCSVVVVFLFVALPSLKRAAPMYLKLFTSSSCTP